MARDVRGAARVATGRDPHTAPKERERMGGGRYDARPGTSSMPSAAEMDRPPSPCGTFGRHGDGRGGINAGIRKIQDADKNGY